jgi:hypothetical protein
MITLVSSTLNPLRNEITLVVTGIHVPDFMLLSDINDLFKYECPDFGTSILHYDDSKCLNNKETYITTFSLHTFSLYVHSNTRAWHYSKILDGDKL